MKLVVIIIYHGLSLVCATSHIDHILTSHIIVRLRNKISSTLLKTFCQMERFAIGSSHGNWQRIGNRAWYLRSSVSLSFVDEELYGVMYRYMTWRHMTSLQMASALSDIQILSWIDPRLYIYIYIYIYIYNYNIKTQTPGDQVKVNLSMETFRLFVPL